MNPRRAGRSPDSSKIMRKKIEICPGCRRMSSFAA
jgi:hypothetical protein